MIGGPHFPIKQEQAFVSSAGGQIEVGARCKLRGCAVGSAVSPRFAFSVVITNFLSNGESAAAPGRPCNVKMEC